MARQTGERVTYLRVLVFGDDIAGAIGAGLRVQQLPVLGADLLELRVHKELAIVRFAHHSVDHES